MSVSISTFMSENTADNNVLTSFSDIVISCAARFCGAAILLIQILNEVFDGALLEILIGFGSWLLFFSLSQRKIKSWYQSSKGKKIADSYDDISEKNPCRKNEAPEVLADDRHMPEQAQHDVQELHRFIEGLSNREIQLAPAIVVQKYNELVCRRNFRQNMGGEQRARAFYLTLASCSKGCHGNAQSKINWLQRLLGDMRQFAFSRSLEFYTSLVKLYMQDGHHQVALAIPREMSYDGIHPDYGVLICFMNAAMVCDEGDQVLHFFKEIGKFGPPSLRSYMTVLGVYKTRCDWKGAVSLLDSMQEAGASPDTLILNQVLRLCIDAGQMPAAESLFRQWCMLCDVISCNTLIKGFTQQADLPNAERILEHMLKAGPSPNLVTFNTVIDCAVRSLNCMESSHRGGNSKTNAPCDDSNRAKSIRTLAQRPWELLEQLTALGLEPDRYTCSIMVKGMHYSGITSTELDRAIALLHRVGPSELQPPLHANSSESKCNIRLVEVLFNTLLDICASSHDLDRMSAIFAMMQEFRVSITSVTFGILMKAFGHAGRLERCHEVWDGMLAAKMRPTVVTYGCYIDACIRNNDIDSAQRIFESMSMNGVHPNAVVYTSLIRGFASVGQPSRALLLYQQMRKNRVQPTSVTFNSVLDLVARQLSDPAMLQSVLRDMREATAGADSVICAILLKACCSTGKIVNAMELFREIQGKSFQWDYSALDALLLACSRTDNVDDADEVFQEMRRIGSAPSQIAATCFVKMYGRARMPQKAEAVIGTLQSEFGVTPSFQACANLIQSLTQNAMLRRSLDIFKRLSESGLQLDVGTHVTIIQNCIELGEYDTAMEIVRKASVPLQPAVLQNLLDAMLAAQRHSLAHELNTILSKRGYQCRPKVFSSRSA